MGRDNIKMGLQEFGWGGVMNWIDLTDGMDRQ